MTKALPQKLLHCFFVCLLMAALVPAKAQYVTIPDANFAAFLANNGYGACMNGNQLDTTCPAVKQATSINCQSQGILDITGIQYFTALDSLYCNSNSITALPDFSNLSHLEIFDCSSNQLTSLGNATAVNFYCDYNPLGYNLYVPPGVQTFTCGGLPYTQYIQAQNDTVLIGFYCGGDFFQDALLGITGLPATLQTLVCSYCPNLYILDAQLPTSLQFFDCDDDGSIGSLPSLPDGLSFITCESSGLSSLPALPGGLNYLDCSYNNISSLPSLPTGLQDLNCSFNNISSLPNLPNSLQKLECVSSFLTVLPGLPASLNELDCQFNMIRSLPALPVNLGTLYCGNNLLTSLPTLPPNLSTLDCENDYILALPSLPLSLTTLNCNYDTVLTNLPLLPPHLTTLSFEYCNLTSLPGLPDTIIGLDVTGNKNLSCLPQLKYVEGIAFFGTSVTCLPDYPNGLIGSTPNLDTFPLCGIFNSSGCSVYWDISGLVYYDENTNCIFDSIDVAQGNVKLRLFNSGSLVQQTYSGDGSFSFQTAQGDFSVIIDTINLPFTVSCNAAVVYDTITGIDSLRYNNNFALKCRTEGFDIGVQSVLNNATPRPGATFQLSAIAGDESQLFGAHCAAGISGKVQITFSGPVTYKGIAPGALATTSTSGNTITWNISDFGTVNDNTAFNTNFQVDDHAIAGTQICFTVSLTPTTGDYIPSNNTLTYCFPVANSQDPNEKEVYPTTIDSGGQWLTYTVRFQNTGTAPALNIIVRDTLSANLDPSSFQLLTYSAKNLTQLFGNVIVFNFPNINLPDSLTSDSVSRGFVQYRVKTIANLQPGSVVSNSASIYFDLNAPVLTNTVSDTVAPQSACSPDTTNLQQAICSGDSVLVGNQAFYNSGNFTLTLTNAGGCDSIVNLALTVNAADTLLMPLQVCSGDSALFNGTYYKTAGIYTFNYTNINGCDSQLIVSVTVSGNDTIAVAQTICSGDSVLFNGIYYNSSGTYTAQFTSTGGCDSLVNFTLTVSPGDTFTYYETICSIDSFLFGGNYLNTAGFYTADYTNTSGCDSLLILYLNVTQPDTEKISWGLCAANGYYFYGTYLTAPGIYDTTVTGGCDTVVILNLFTAVPLPATQVYDTICTMDSIFFNGVYYNTTGIDSAHLSGIYGCDSLVILNLTLTSTLYGSATASICAGDTFYIGNNAYTQTGTFTDTLQSAAGCDSVVRISLTVNPIATDTLITSICAGDTLFIGSTPYTQAGTFTDTLQTTNGCDSIVTLTLTVNQMVHDTVEASICAGDTFYVGTIPYTVSGTYIAIIQSGSGCDSVVTLNLTVNNSGLVDSINIGNECYPGGSPGLISCAWYAILLAEFSTPVDSFYWTINNSVFRNLDTLLVAIPEDSSGNPQFDLIVSPFNSYPVCLTAYSGCGEASICDTLNIWFEGIQPVNPDNAVSLYPNPASNLIYIKTEGLHPETITIYDAAGRKINTMPYAPEVDIHNLSAGVYLMEINSLEGVARKRWVKTSE